MARCGCGGGLCSCAVVAGDNVTVTGSGSAANPYVVSSEVPCETVRACLSPGDGIDFDQAAGVIAADLSEQAGNNLTVAPDGGLFVPTGAATVTTGCGLTGDGSGSAPLTVNTGTWPYACSVDDFGGVVVCDDNGVLRSEPRGQASMTRYVEQRTYNDRRIPSGSVQTADTFSTTIRNPDRCRSALLVVEQEVDVYMVLPAGAGAATGFDGDEMYYTRNTGTGTITGAHAQATKVISRGTLAPGASVALSFSATVGRGSGGAYYYRIDAIIRALLISL